MRPQLEVEPRRASTARRVLACGAAAGAASTVVFAAVHEVLISDIWYAMGPMAAAGAACGLCLAWSHHRLFGRLTPQTWAGYNLLFVVLLGALGLASLVLFEPVTTVQAVLAANTSPRDLIVRALPLTVGFAVAAAAAVSARWARGPADAAAVLVTCAVMMAVLGLNVSILGLVALTRGTAVLVAELFALIVVLAAVYAGAYAGLMRWAPARRVPPPHPA